ncbi:hypothetical protein ACJX0J_026266, partial [Zea mays]
FNYMISVIYEFYLFIVASFWLPTEARTMVKFPIVPATTSLLEEHPSDLIEHYNLLGHLTLHSSFSFPSKAITSKIPSGFVDTGIMDPYNMNPLLQMPAIEDKLWGRSFAVIFCFSWNFAV